MSELDARQKIAEIAALVAEKERETQKIAAIDRKIAEIVGVGPKNQRKNKRETRSAKDFAAACGL